MPSYKQVHNRIQERVRQISKKQEYIDSKIYNWTFEEETKKRPREEMLQVFEKDIEDQLIYIFGEEWKSKINLKWDGQFAFANGYDLALNVWLSKQGYASKEYRITGYKVPVHIGGEKLMIISKTLTVIEKNMIAKHPDLRLKLPGTVIPDSVRISGIRIPAQVFNWEHRGVEWTGDWLIIPNENPSTASVDSLVAGAFMLLAFGILMAVLTILNQMV